MSLKHLKLHKRWRKRPSYKLIMLIMQCQIKLNHWQVNQKYWFGHYKLTQMKNHLVLKYNRFPLVPNLFVLLCSSTLWSFCGLSFFMYIYIAIQLKPLLHYYIFISSKCLLFVWCLWWMFRLCLIHLFILM